MMFFVGQNAPTDMVTDTSRGIDGASAHVNIAPVRWDFTAHISLQYLWSAIQIAAFNII